MPGAALPAQAQEARRSRITPYIEVGQVLTGDLQSGDTLTYSTASVGVDASVHTRRVEVQLDYRYERRFSYQKKVGDDDVHSGIATIRARVAPSLTIEAGGIATRARSDVRGDAPGNLAGNVRNVGQVYSAYIGPSVSTHVGPVFVNSAYRFGYTKVESPTGGTGVPAGQAPLDVYDSSKVHVATVSTGVKSGTVLPVGITLSGSYTREDAGQLAQRFEGKYARGDVVLPVGRGLAVEGGAGYEKIEISQKDPKLDGTGTPIVDGAGREVTDPASPRRLSYAFDGLFWDAGVVWHPSRRTFLEARAGKRYGSMSYTGSLSYEIGPGSGIQIGVYDSVTSFGQQLGGSLSSLPSAFVTSNDPFGNQYNGCVYGTSGSAAGSCMNGIFASVATANYRARGVTGVVVLGRGPTRIGFGGGYARRDFIAPTTGTGTGLNVNGTSDQSFYAQLFGSEQLGRNSSLSGTAFASYYTTDLPGSDPVLGWGANGAYTHRFGHLDATAALGIYGFESQANDKETAAQALVGLRYGF
ncbi:MAG: hypothetical protein WDN44_11225 [Sphingomonas sp.]